MQAPDLLREHIVATLRRLTPDLVSGPESAELLAGAARWQSIPGGNVLFRKGDPSDTVFIVVSGLLAVEMKSADGGADRIISRLGAGEVVGEMGCITGQPRTASVRALRSSEILEIQWSDIEQIAARDPSILMSICKTVVDRMARAQDGTLPTFQPSTFAVTWLGDEVNARQFAERFRDALAVYGNAYLMTHETGRGMTSAGLNQIEMAHKYVVYLTDKGSSSWTNRCIRQADAVLVCARGGTPPQPLPKRELGIGPDIPIILVLDWPADVRQPHGTAGWISSAGASRHFHVRDAKNVGRIARLLTGNGFGLVLSGGGARGIAHLGVAYALMDHGIDIDVVCGTSIGAIIGAGIALQWERDYMQVRMEKFVKVHPLRDLTFPRWSILSGRHLRRSLLDWFGDVQIEDIPTPYACISTNLSTGYQFVHRSGDLKTWTRASAALPGIYPPVELNGHFHVDGGVLNNMPADTMRETGAGFVLGVDVGADALPEAPGAVQVKLNILELLVRVGSIGDGALASARKKHCDIIIVPNVTSVGLLAFKAWQRAVDAGFKATVERIEEISSKRQAGVSPELMAAARL